MLLTRMCIPLWDLGLGLGVMLRGTLRPLLLPTHPLTIAVAARWRARGHRYLLSLFIAHVSRYPTLSALTSTTILHPSLSFPPPCSYDLRVPVFRPLLHVRAYRRTMADDLVVVSRLAVALAVVYHYCPFVPCWVFPHVVV